MNREEFVNQYVISFLAAHAADKYEHVCSIVSHDIFTRQPVKDAHTLALKAWDERCEYLDNVAEYLDKVADGRGMEGM